MAADVYNGMADKWPVRSASFDPPRLAFAVTPDDSKDLTNPAGTNMPAYATSLFIGGNSGSQTLSVIMAGDKSASGAGTAVSLGIVPQGTYLPIAVRRVMSTGTTVTNIVAFCD